MFANCSFTIYIYIYVLRAASFLLCLRSLLSSTWLVAKHIAPTPPLVGSQVVACAHIRSLHISGTRAASQVACGINGCKGESRMVNPGPKAKQFLYRDASLQRCLPTLLINSAIPALSPRELSFQPPNLLDHQTIFPASDFPRFVPHVQGLGPAKEGARSVDGASPSRAHPFIWCAFAIKEIGSFHPCNGRTRYKLFWGHWLPALTNTRLLQGRGAVDGREWSPPTMTIFQQ